jgi:hypothetical protein
MEMQRKPFGRTASGRDGGSRVMTVRVPAPYEGVGNALRSTYAPGRDSLPDDMMLLLAKLDRH